MKLMVLDPGVSDEMIAERKRLGIDRYDEVWEGVYVMPPMANTMHQDMVLELAAILREVVVLPGLGRVHPGANVSDRETAWEKNFRCPDVLAALNGGRAIDRGAHWQGGPDFVVEIRSPGDDTFEKLPFYAGIGVREVLVLDRDTREPALYRLVRKRLAPVKPGEFGDRPALVSEVLPLAFRRVERKDGPRLEVRRTAGRKKTWLV